MLWRALAVVATRDTRVQGVDFRSLAARAEAQRILMKVRRLKVARKALLPESNKSVAAN